MRLFEVRERWVRWWEWDSGDDDEDEDASEDESPVLVRVKNRVQSAILEGRNIEVTKEL